jgi:hypothetical protein
MGSHRYLSRAWSWGSFTPKTTKLQAVRFPHHAIGMKFADRRLATENPFGRRAGRAYSGQMKVSFTRAAARAIGSPAAAA